MVARFGVALLLAAGATSCLRYEFDQEFWLRVDGTGTVYVTGRPALWTAFKGLPDTGDAARLEAAARRLFEGSGLVVRRARVTARAGRRYLFIAADFDDVNRLGRSPAFPDLRLRLDRAGQRLRLDGEWAPRARRPELADTETDGWAAVRFHMPSKVFAHRNAADGVERGNIVSWRTPVAAALAGGRLEIGASLGSRSILWSSVGVFAAAILAALLGLAAAFFLAARRGRALSAEPAPPTAAPRAVAPGKRPGPFAG